MAAFETVDSYIASFPPDVRRTLEAVRATIRSAVPGTEETITYGMPTYKRGDERIVYFAGWKHHVSVYPTPGGDASLERELAPFKAARSTLQFPLGSAMPLDLIRRVAARLLEQAEERTPS